MRLLLWLWKCRKSDIIRRSNFPCRCRLPGLVQTWLPLNIHDTSPSCGAPSLHTARCIVGLNTYPTHRLITDITSDYSIPALHYTRWWALIERFQIQKFSALCTKSFVFDIPITRHFLSIIFWYPFSHSASTPEGNLWAEPRWLLYINWYSPIFVCLEKVCLLKK